MHNSIQEFENIDSEPALRAFLQKYGFRMADSRSHADQYVLGAFLGKLGETHAKITHRLLDDNAGRAAGLERNQVILDMEGQPSVEIRFRGIY
jgi:hypothetical protein